MKITNRWKIEKNNDDQFSGNDWPVCYVGYNGEDNKHYSVVTDRVRASELDDLTAKELAFVISKVPKMLNLLEKVSTEIKPKLVFGEENEILKLLENINYFLNRIENYDLSTEPMFTD